MFDEDKLYIGAKCYAPGTEYIVPSLKRDYRAGGNDNITFMFDPFNDGANAFGSTSRSKMTELLMPHDRGKDQRFHRALIEDTFMHIDTSDGGLDLRTRSGAQMGHCLAPGDFVDVYSPQLAQLDERSQMGRSRLRSKADDRSRNNVHGRLREHSQLKEIATSEMLLEQQQRDTQRAAAAWVVDLDKPKAASD